MPRSDLPFGSEFSPDQIGPPSSPGREGNEPSVLLLALDARPLEYGCLDAAPGFSDLPAFPVAGSCIVKMKSAIS